MEVLQERLISNVVEEWKWRGVPVLSHAEIICTDETYKDKVNLTIALVVVKRISDIP